MAYTIEDMYREVGQSDDPIVGLRASIKKWEQIVGGDYESYAPTADCGLCVVFRAKHTACMSYMGFPGKSPCFIARESAEVLEILERRLAEEEQDGTSNHS